jgi:ketosteroid isomerase-like protein
MTHRDEIERIITQAYAARRDGDLDTLGRIFSDQAEFRLAGSAGASPVASAAIGTKEIKHALLEMITVFQWLDQKILTMIIEGSRAAVHWRGKIHSTATGESVETELVDIFKIENGRIASLIEFCDTALAARLMGATPSA